jgi:hypothetical protein
MATIQIEADMSTEQLLHVVEQLPPREFAILLAQLLERARSAARAEPASLATGTPAERNPYLAAAGMFADDSFADEVDAYIAAQRERERQDAAREADA